MENLAIEHCPPKRNTGKIKTENTSVFPSERTKGGCGPSDQDKEKNKR